MSCELSSLETQSTVRETEGKERSRVSFCFSLISEGERKKNVCVIGLPFTERERERENKFRLLVYSHI